MRFDQLLEATGRYSFKQEATGFLGTETMMGVLKEEGTTD